MASTVIPPRPAQLGLFGGRHGDDPPAAVVVAACAPVWGEGADDNAEIHQLFSRRALLPDLSTRCPRCGDVVAVEPCAAWRGGPGPEYPGAAVHYDLSGCPCPGSLDDTRSDCNE